MKVFVSILICVLAASFVFSQMDSLNLALDNAQGEERLSILLSIAQDAQNANECADAANQLLQEATDLSDYYFIGMAHHHLGHSLALLGKVSESIEEHFFAIEAFKKANRDDKIARQYMNLGNRFADIAMYDSALSMYTLGQNMAIHAQNTFVIYGGYINISTIHHERGDREKELDYLLKAKALVEGIGDSNSIALMNFNIAVFYTNSGEYYKSAELALEAYEMYKKTENASGLASIHSLWSEIHFKHDRFDSALIELERANVLYTEVGD